ncbi:MAG: preprotein translocase subunit SecY [Clostridia bacterium]|nr:preprotein translocase subunit SecY [Clostridia bacterium]
MFQTIKNAWHIEDTRRKLIYTAFIVILYRIGCIIPVPYVDSAAWAATFDSETTGTIFGYLNILSGSSFSQGTLFALSITPYITASIVMQLLTIAIPPLERLAKEPDGQKKITQITRYVTVILAIVTALGYYLTMRNQGALSDKGFFAGLVIVTSYVAGASLIMWLGEKINENGVGNGISIILFFNIISRFGSLLNVAISVGKTGTGWIFVILAAVIMLAVITFIVWMNDAERRLPVQYAKRTVGRKMYGGMNTHLPIKLNMSGVMPIIFAQSIVSLPSTLGLIFGWNQQGGILKFFSMTSAFGIALNFILIIAFAYFYLTISFNPVEVANNLKKNGGTILGYRPGTPTANYIRKVLNRITLIGSLFLGIIAVFPQLIALLWPKSNLGYLVFGGSSLIIIIGVVLETIKELESEVTMRHYKGFLE